MANYTNPRDALEHNVTGAIDRGTAEPVVGVPACIICKKAKGHADLEDRCGRCYDKLEQYRSGNM